jgi:predicted amidohydrolase
VTGGENATTMRLAAVQIRSEPGQAEANWAHAAPFIDQAAAQGARLVVLPELFSCGYVASRAIWGYVASRAIWGNGRGPRRLARHGQLPAPTTGHDSLQVLAEAIDALARLRTP